MNDWVVKTYILQNGVLRSAKYAYHDCIRRTAYIEVANGVVIASKYARKASTYVTVSKRPDRMEAQATVPVNCVGTIYIASKLVVLIESIVYILKILAISDQMQSGGTGPTLSSYGLSIVATSIFYGERKNIISSRIKAVYPDWSVNVVAREM